MIDFDNLPVLIGPRFRRIMAERQDREKLAHAHLKRRTTGAKNHSTNRERSKAESAKHSKLQHAIRVRSDTVAAYRNEVRRYWAGERDTHPELVLD